MATPRPQWDVRDLVKLTFQRCWLARRPCDPRLLRLQVALLDAIIHVDFLACRLITCCSLAVCFSEKLLSSMLALVVVPATMEALNWCKCQGTYATRIDYRGQLKPSAGFLT